MLFVGRCRHSCGATRKGRPVFFNDGRFHAARDNAYAAVLLCIPCRRALTTVRVVTSLQLLTRPAICASSTSPCWSLQLAPSCVRGSVSARQAPRSRNVTMPYLLLRRCLVASAMTAAVASALLELSAATVEPMAKAVVMVKVVEAANTAAKEYAWLTARRTPGIELTRIGRIRRARVVITGSAAQSIVPSSSTANRTSAFMIRTCHTPFSQHLPPLFAAVGAVARSPAACFAWQLARFACPVPLSWSLIAYSLPHRRND
ncbi:hypothetical protein HDG42_001068 [Paraburkholderia sp. JPY171]|nr:hypothetical protein [Paraburkholderia atlantica]